MSKKTKKVLKRKVLIIDKIENIKNYHTPYIKKLKEDGYEIHIATDGQEEIQECDKLFLINFKTIINQYIILKKIIKQNNYNIIHCYTNLARFAVRNQKNAKIIYTTYGFKFYKGAPLKKWIRYYPIEKYLSKKTDVIITINDDDYFLAKNKFKNTKIELINGFGIDENQFDFKPNEKDKEEFLKEFNLNEEDFVFLSIGDLTQKNNQIMQIDGILNLMHKYKNIKLLIVGIGELEEYYNHIIFKYGLDQNIRLLGERNDIIRLIKLCDCYIDTSKNELNSINIIKAMFANKPIIASKIKGHNNLLKNDNLVNLNDINELSLKMEIRILDRSEVSYNIEKYKLDKVIRKLKKIYEK